MNEKNILWLLAWTILIVIISSIAGSISMENYYKTEIIKHGYGYYDSQTSEFVFKKSNKPVKDER